MNLFTSTYDLVRQIPPGRVSTYGAVATALGDIIASRAVGRMMNQNPDPDTMPCFKIVYSDGRLGGFGRGIQDKIRRLGEDNIQVKDGKIVDFQHVFFDDFRTDFPLKHFRAEDTVIFNNYLDNLQDLLFSDYSSSGGVKLKRLEATRTGLIAAHPG